MQYTNTLDFNGGMKVRTVISTVLRKLSEILQLEVGIGARTIIKNARLSRF